MLASGITTTYYTTNITITSGREYQFQIVARNSIGFSQNSTAITIVAAQVPDQPISISTQINNDFVQIFWTTPFDGSSPIIGYTIKILQSNGITFTEDVVNCNGLS